MRRAIALALLLGVAGLWGGTPQGAALEDEGAVPQGIIASPAKSQLSVEIETDREVYRPGEAVELRVKLSRDAYLYVYDIDPAGRVTLLFPNGFSRDNLLPAGVKRLPDGDYSFVTTEPEGVEALQAIALLKPIPLLELSAQALDRHAFPQLGESAQALKPHVVRMIEAAVEPGEWAADWTRFLVARAFAYLRVATRPEGAQVYVNGRLKGQSPVELAIEAGETRIAIEKEGYRRWAETITLRDRTRHELDVRLEPRPPAPAFPPPEPPGVDLGRLPPVRLGLSAGLNGAGTFSLGLDLGLSPTLSLGGSLSFTGEDVPPYHDVGHPVNFERERVYNWGPETEAYAKLTLPVGALSVHLGVGVAVQEKVHLAQPAGGVEASAPKPLIEIRPHGYRETEGIPTLFGGAGLRISSAELGLGFHNRRGWVLGLTLKF